MAYGKSRKGLPKGGSRKSGLHSHPGKMKGDPSSSMDKCGLPNYKTTGLHSGGEQARPA